MHQQPLPITPIIIINWNGIEDTIECIDSLATQSDKNFEVFLVDNNSSSKEQERLKKQFSKVEWINLIFNAENQGFTRGNNRIFEKCLSSEPPYDYIILLNNDTVVDKDWFKNIVKSAEVNKADIVSSKMIDYYNRSIMDNAGHYMLNTGEILSVGHQKPIENYNDAKLNLGACAGAALYRTSMLREIGIFDEYFDTGYEDAEIGLRAVVLGYKCWYEPSAIVFHKMGQSIKKIFSYEYMLKMHKAIWYTYFKLMPLGRILISLPAMILKYLLMIIINIVFWQPQLLRLMFEPLYVIMFKDLRKVKIARRAIFKKSHKLNSFQISQKQTFFLAFDFGRFLDIFIFKKRSFFEKYKS